MADYVNDPRFSRDFELPPDPANGRTTPFKVRYADFGYRNEAHPEQEHVLLFFGPLMGSRLLHIAKDEVARKRKIRIISPDRPGIGGTDALDPAHTVELWREVMLALLRHLEIEHVSVACHSGGTIAALDMLLHHPEILHPERSYIAIGAPWIMPSHTSSTALAIVKALPASVVGQTDKFARLMNNHIGPTLGFFFGLSGAVVTKLTPSATAPRDDAEAPEREGAQFEDQLWSKIIHRVYADGVRGVGAHAVLLMQKADGGRAAGWSDWGDYDTLVPRLAEVLRATGRRLTVDVFYAQSDFLIGDAGSKGPRWFDRLWDAPYCGDVVDYHRADVEGADHDTVWNLRWGVAQAVFERIGEPVVDEAPSNPPENITSG